jgi:hypothetical protein
LTFAMLELIVGKSGAKWISLCLSGKNGSRVD